MAPALRYAAGSPELDTEERQSTEMFKPVNKSHAIIDVRFVIDIDRPWLAEDQPFIEEGYKKYWQQVLPRRVQGQQVLVNLGPQIRGLGVGTLPNPMAPLTYNAVSRDGSLEWELGFEGNQLRVTCGKYSRWEQVWKVAGNLFQMAGKSLNGRDTAIMAVELTYRDLFIWEGEGDYDVGELLSHEQGVIGISATKHGSSWHSHQGWMRSQDKWPGVNYLERIHLDASKVMVRQEEKFGVFITTTTRLGHGGTERLFSLQKGFNIPQAVRAGSDDGSSRFEWLHTQAKKVFSQVLTREAQRCVDLWVE